MVVEERQKQVHLICSPLCRIISYFDNVSPIYSEGFEILLQNELWKNLISRMRIACQMESKKHHQSRGRPFLY